MSTLILTAHGSKDPRSAANTHAIAERLRTMRPGLNVQAAFLERNTPSLPDALEALPDNHHAVITPLLLASAYHARTDIPRQLRTCTRTPHPRQADTLGHDPRLISVLHHRLTELDVLPHDRTLGVIVVAVGSTNPTANAHTAHVATKLAAGTHWAGTTPAYATGPGPTPAQAADQLRHHGAHRIVIAPWFLAPGLITDRIATYAQHANITMAAPLGPHPLIAQTLLDRYDHTQTHQLAA